MRDVAYIALGSNLGDRAAYLALARRGLAAIPRSQLRAVSSIEETQPLGPIPQPPYLNQMAALETDLGPAELLDALQRIERAAGRVRDQRWGPRTLDLDIVLFEKQSVVTDRLVVPHPELARRDFWQRGLDELRAGV
ncbi:MAG: 2-amino-4-hydroxy-6-hydroxymethyldihydropteridine diphosphokinase [Gemmatimonadaceae bacterium]